MPDNALPPEGILLVDKSKGKGSFNLVAALRKHLGVKKIGHAGTLDPFATGVMVMLIGRNYTRLSDSLLSHDKEYKVEVFLGATTDTYDCEGEILTRSDIIPSEEELKRCLETFQGEVEQIPPMYSAKKIQGQKLYELARKGEVVERKPVKVRMAIELLRYVYPHVELQVKCSKGTYMRSLGYDLGQLLGCGAHLSNLQRTRSGPFRLEDCIDGSRLGDYDLRARLITAP